MENRTSQAKDQISMKIVHVVYAFATAMLFVALISVSVAIWAARQSDFHNDRTALAHKSYQTHLKLTADTYLLFKRFGDLLLGRGSDQEANGEALSTRLRGHIQDIRETINAEIEMVGDDELEELELLSELEGKIEELISRFQLLLRNDGDIRSEWLQLSQSLNVNLKQDFNELITIALEEEAEEVAETDAEAALQMKLVRSISFLLAVIFVCVTIGALWVFRRAFSQPFGTLMAGVREFADGDFSKQIDLHGRNELSETALVLNKMSKVVAERTATLTQQNEELEAAVSERTESLQRLLEEARQFEGNRRQLLADVSHELRTPLTVIQGESDIALRGADKSAAEYKEALQRARSAANHTANLVNDLLFIARNEAGTLSLRRENADITEMISDVIELYGTEVTFEKPATRIDANVDHTRMRQAILAVFDNAKNHGAGEIKVTLTDHDSTFVIAVADEGEGITESEKETVFERFFRGSNAANRYTEGLGLGLPIVRSIARAHGGDVRILDNQPKGTIISLEVPKA